MSKFRRLAESHRVDEIVAVATSAVREADNGGEFLLAIRQQTGIRARVISGTEEARLIHLAAAYGVGAPRRGRRRRRHRRRQRGNHPRAPARRSSMGQSFKLGVIRLTERFVKSDSAHPSRRAQARPARRSRAGRISRSARGRWLRPPGRYLGNDPEPRRRGARRERAAGGRLAPQPARRRQTAPPRAQDAVVHRLWSSASACPVSNRGAPTWPWPAPCCSTRSCGASAQRKSPCAICRCGRGSSSTTSRAIARRSRRPTAIRTSAGAASSSSRSAATTGRTMRIRSRVWRWRCSTRREACTA